MTNQDSATRAPNKEIREAFELSYAADADDPASATELSHFTNGWRACVMSTTRGPVAREAPPAAYLTLDEEGSPCMLFFDVVEARSYCALGEDPEPLFRNAAPQASADDVRNAALDALEAARRFIRNGIEFGHIRMPDADRPDPAHRTPGMIDAAIRALKQLQADKAARCTCPSGDGSLRNPCAAHPAKASGNGGKEWSDS